jgi:6-bladed beta-propeller
MKIKGIFVAFSVSLSIFSCRSQQERPRKTYQGPVEVIHNGFKPYRIKGELSHLTLEKYLTIDFENPDLAAIGIPRIASFDVDSRGNIYVWCQRGSGNFIFKFAPSGKFDRAFGRSGQGPGEIAALSYLRLSERDEVIVSDYDRTKLIVMTAGGNVIREIKLTSSMDTATLLANGKLLAWKSTSHPEEGVEELRVVLCDTKLKELAILGPAEKLPNFAKVKKINGLETMPTWGQGSISNGWIYVGNKQSGYEISVYDLEGKLTRKIRKAYKPAPVPEGFKKQVVDVFDMPIHEGQKGKLYLPASMPPFQYFFPDDQGRLFVMTFEKGESPGYYLYDIFNPEGVYVGRTSLDNSGNESSEIWGGPFEVRAKNNLLYYLRAKDSGFQELVVYRMIWMN